MRLKPRGRTQEDEALTRDLRIPKGAELTISRCGNHVKQGR